MRWPQQFVNFLYSNEFVSFQETQQVDKMSIAQWFISLFRKRRTLPSEDSTTDDDNVTPEAEGATQEVNHKYPLSFSDVKNVIKIDAKSKMINLSKVKFHKLSESDGGEALYFFLDQHPKPEDVKEILVANGKERAQLSAIPLAIGRFENLLTLELSNNSLSELPWSLLYLKHIIKLDLSFNLFRSVPKIVQQLNTLQILNLKGNYFLQSLPTYLLEMKDLKTVDVSLCHLKYPPQAVCNKGFSEIRKSLKSRSNRNDLWSGSRPCADESYLFSSSGQDVTTLHEICVQCILANKVNFLSYMGVAPKIKTFLVECQDAYDHRIELSKCSNCKNFFSTKENFLLHNC